MTGKTVPYKSRQGLLTLRAQLGQAAHRRLPNSARIAVSMTGKFVQPITGRGRTIPPVISGLLTGRDFTMKAILGIIVLFLNFAGWYGIYTVGGSVFGEAKLGWSNTPLFAKTAQEEQVSVPVIVTVTADALNMRTGPGPDNALVMALHKGDVLTVLEINEQTKWAKVEYNGKSGYVHSDYIEEKRND